MLRPFIWKYLVVGVVAAAVITMFGCASDAHDSGTYSDTPSPTLATASESQVPKPIGTGVFEPNDAGFSGTIVILIDADDNVEIALGNMGVPADVSDWELAFLAGPLEGTCWSDNASFNLGRIDEFGMPLPTEQFISQLSDFPGENGALTWGWLVVTQATPDFVERVATDPSTCARQILAVAPVDWSDELRVRLG